MFPLTVIAVPASFVPVIVTVAAFSVLLMMLSDATVWIVGAVGAIVSNPLPTILAVVICKCEIAVRSVTIETPISNKLLRSVLLASVAAVSFNFAISTVVILIPLLGSPPLSNDCKNCAIFTTVGSVTFVLNTPSTKSCGRTLPSALISVDLISPIVTFPTLKIIVSPAL